ncbi:MAG: hypothetical protein CMLOHMNK_01433 [Steroidobacteraceae bacterium]|nr:hypothetical protein [Steroidobacteraceae bacterium]
MKRRDFLVSTATMAGAAIPVVGFGQSKPCPPPGVSAGGGTTASTTCANESVAADWAARIAGAGVVWHHNFDSAAEVNQFRWTNGPGNDPGGLGPGGQYVTHQASGGADGGGFMRLAYPLGNASGRGGSYWHRPFNPLTGAGNGRGVDDPGASGTIAPVAFVATQNGSVLYNWGNESNPGWYMHPAHQASYSGKFQGHDFWLQVRVRRAQRPGPPPDSGNYSYITGKNVWFTTTNSSYTAQEIVTYGQAAGEDVVGKYGRHRMYGGYNYNPFGGSQDNESVTISNLNVAWRYSGGWDTLLYHVTPGTNGGTGSNRTRIEVWAAHQGETSYTKIWDTLYTGHFDGGSNSVGAPGLPGWNALILAIYHNGSTFTTTAFDFDYDQVIFSKQFIPCPTA